MIEQNRSDIYGYWYTFANGSGGVFFPGSTPHPVLGRYMVETPLVAMQWDLTHQTPMTEKLQEVVNAMLLGWLCPEAGGYLDGPSVEDCVKRLDDACAAYVGCMNLNHRELVEEFYDTVANMFKTAGLSHPIPKEYKDVD